MIVEKDYLIQFQLIKDSQRLKTNTNKLNLKWIQWLNFWNCDWQTSCPSLPGFLTISNQESALCWPKRTQLWSVVCHSPPFSKLTDSVIPCQSKTQYLGVNIGKTLVCSWEILPNKSASKGYSSSSCMWHLKNVSLLLGQNNGDSCACCRFTGSQNWSPAYQGFRILGL